MEQVVNNVLSRLEQVAARLEKIEKQLASGASPSAASSSASAGDVAPSVAAFDNIVDEHLNGYYSISEQIGGLVNEQATAFKNLIAVHRNLLQVASTSKKPSDADLQKIVAPQGEAGKKVSEIASKNRPNPLYVNLATVGEAVASFDWFAYAPTPVPYIHETIGSSEFHSNKIRREQKGKDDKQVEWVTHFNGFLKAFEAYVKQFHTTGLSWNARGGDALASAASSAPAQASAPSGGAPPPPAGGPPPPGPPPPAAASSGSSHTADASDMSGVFSQLNRGEGVTSGLKKVTADMKSKNRADRSGKVEEIAPKAPAKKAAPKQPPKCELQTNKWVVEYQVSQCNIEITEMKQTIYLYKCEGATVIIKGKFNAITIDSCKKTNVIFDEAISSCEMVNCSGVKVQINQKVPAVTIDKTSGGAIYLSNEGLATQIFTSKSDELNVCIPGPNEDQPILEFPVPEQFLNTIKDGKLHTEMNTHLGE